MDLSLLNSYFISCFSPPTQNFSIPISPANSPSPNLSSISCSPDEIHHLLSTVKAKTVCGHDEISSHMLHNTASSIHTFLSVLFNKSLDTGIFPEAWKVSNISPIFEAGDPKLASNYQPISLLSVPSKILEHIGLPII